MKEETKEKAKGIIEKVWDITKMVSVSLIGFASQIFGTTIRNLLFSQHDQASLYESIKASMGDSNDDIKEKNNKTEDQKEVSKNDIDKEFLKKISKTIVQNDELKKIFNKMNINVELNKEGTEMYVINKLPTNDETQKVYVADVSQLIKDGNAQSLANILVHNLEKQENKETKDNSNMLKEKKFDYRIIGVVRANILTAEMSNILIENKEPNMTLACSNIYQDDMKLPLSFVTNEKRPNMIDIVLNDKIIESVKSSQLSNDNTIKKIEDVVKLEATKIFTKEHNIDGIAFNRSKNGMLNVRIGENQNSYAFNSNGLEELTAEIKDKLKLESDDIKSNITAYTIFNACGCNVDANFISQSDMNPSGKKPENIVKDPITKEYVKPGSFHFSVENGEHGNVIYAHIPHEGKEHVTLGEAINKENIEFEEGIKYKSGYFYEVNVKNGSDISKEIVKIEGNNFIKVNCDNHAQLTSNFETGQCFCNGNPNIINEANERPYMEKREVFAYKELDFSDKALVKQNELLYKCYIENKDNKFIYPEYERIFQGNKDMSKPIEADMTAFKRDMEERIYEYSACGEQSRAKELSDLIHDNDEKSVNDDTFEEEVETSDKEDVEIDDDFDEEYEYDDDFNEEYEEL